MQRFFRTLMLGILLVAGMNGEAFGALVVIDSGKAGSTGPAVFADQAAAQEFFLPELFLEGSSQPSSFMLAELSATFWRRSSEGPNPVVRLQIASALGLGTTSDAVVASFEFEVGSLSPAEHTVFTELELGPGRYFLLASSDVAIDDWVIWSTGSRIVGGKFLASQFDPVNAVDGRWHDWDAWLPPATEGPSLSFRILARSVPEPVGLSVLACIFGLPVAWWRLRSSG